MRNETTNPCVMSPMETAAREGPYRAPLSVDAPFAPSLRFSAWVGGAFAVPASLYVLASVWSLFFAPECSPHAGSLAGEALMLLLLGGATCAFGVLGMRRGTAAIRVRVRVRSWLGKTAWTMIAAAPLVLAAVAMVGTALYFDLEYLFLRCLDLGGIGAFH